MEETEKTYTAWGLDEGEHEAQGLKPMLTPEGQVELLKAKGVTFDRCSEEQAIEALSGRDTFLPRTGSCSRFTAKEARRPNTSSRISQTCLTSMHWTAG